MSEIVRAHAKDVGAIRESLAEAFYDDPVAVWLFARQTRRIRDLATFFSIQLRHGYLPRGVVMSTADFQATAMWIRSWSRPLSIYDRIAHLQIPLLLGERLRSARQLTRTLVGHHPKEPHLYLGTIGVSPSAQSRGYGALLMEAFLADARRLGAGTYLECSSEHNVGFYQGFGFYVERVVQAPEHGPTLWLMRREADLVGPGSGSTDST
ncbi:MAG TPA: GNAT family N-acetyltransferase [Acidimicrobiales bacterium]|nr:GNAT family N-acetyltransferase [Acidimicrobiales bacterium]